MLRAHLHAFLPVRLIDSGPADYAALQPACPIAREQLPFHRRVISHRNPYLNWIEYTTLDHRVQVRALPGARLNKVRMLQFSQTSSDLAIS